MQEDDETISVDPAEGKTAESHIFDDSLRYDEPTSTDSDMSTKTSRRRRQATGNAEMEETFLDGFRSDQRVRLLRDTTLMLLLLITMFVTLAVYFSQSASEREDFEKAFEDQASKVGYAFRSQLEAKLLALDVFSVSIKSYSRSQESSNWPNVTVPDFAERASSTLHAGKGISLAIHPVIKVEEVAEWEEYSIQSQSWLHESIDFQSKYQSAMEGGMNSRTSSRISEVVYRVEDGAPTQVHDSTTLLPLWEHFPFHDGLPPVNYDAMGDRLHRYALDEVLENGVPVLGQAFDLSRSFHGLAIDVMNEEFYGLEWSEIWNKTTNNSISSINNSSTPAITQSTMTPSSTSSTIARADNSDTHHRRRLLLRNSHLDRTNSEAVVHEDDLDPPEDKLKDLSGATRKQHNDEDGPATTIWYPVLSDPSRNPPDVVAVVSLTAALNSFFDPDLPISNGLVVVIVNGCKQAMTFEFVDGEAIYLGPDDYHDPDFEQHEQRFNLIVTDNVPLSQSFCPYRAFVYPSSRMRQEYASGRISFFSILIAAVFLVTIIIFMAFDYLVNRHQRNLADAATKTTAIVSSLFPKIVRDRLLEEQENASPPPKKKLFTSKSCSSLRLKESNQGTIADLFPNTTIMFGDVAGFTAWSSSRQPSEVFMLLENMYGALDKLARAMDVFKVETIGDCYMAVTGLPTPQEDHHLRMVKFARYALQKVSVVTHEMEVSLGPDTANLGFRIGLHSGPVTAGVLRGEKSRFQLFGDTVNTASRMESTGSRNQIQISQATADLLVASGKSHWMKKREDLVEAKGKGKVQTHWIYSSCKSSDNGESLFRETSLSLGVTPKQLQSTRQGAVGKKNHAQQSMIDWQVELLSRILKQIVLHRKLTQQRNEVKPFRYVETTTKSIPRNNIAETISMPTFDPVKEEAVTTESVELSPTVMKQLEDLVATYAELYRENNFHNFDHACHVTMSANKLLQRIVIRPQEEKNFWKEAHDYTHGLASDPMTQFAVLFSGP